MDHLINPHHDLMLIDKHRTARLRRIILRAARVPFLVMLLGIAALVVANLDGYLKHFNQPYLLTNLDRVGNILISLAIIAFIYNAAVLFCRHFELKYTKQHHVATLVLASLRGGLRIIFILIFIKIVIDLSNPTEASLILANNIIKIIIISAIGWIAIRVLYTFEAVMHQSMMRLSTQSTQKENNRLKDLYTKTHILRNIITIIIILLTIAAILMSFESVRNIGISLLASAGFVTAIAGLAAQKGLSSLFAGLQIALSKRIQMGDTVKIEGTMGVIEEINFTYVVLKLSDYKRFVVPIGFFIEKPFENWSHAENK